MRRLGRVHVRRARRLLPALFLVLLGVAVYAAVTNPIDLPRIRWDGIATLFYFQDFREHRREAGLLFRAVAASAHVVALDRGTVLRDLASGGIAIRGVAAHRCLVLGMRTVGLSFVCAAVSVVGALRHVDPRWLYYGPISRAPALLMGAALAAGGRDGWSDCVASVAGCARSSGHHRRRLLGL